MAGELEDLENETTPGKKHDRDHTKYILVAVGILTVALGYMTYRRMSAGSQAAQPAQAIDPNTGQPAGSAADIAALTGGSNGQTGMGSSSPDFSALSTSLNALNAETQQLVSVLTPPPASTPAPVYSDLSGAVPNSGGYQAIGGLGTASKPIVTPQGSFIGVASGQVEQTLQAAGAPIYALTSPGGPNPFTQVDPNKLAPGTNIYQKVA